MTHAIKGVEDPEPYARHRLIAFYVSLAINGASMLKWPPGVANVGMLYGSLSYLFPQRWSGLLRTVASRRSQDP